MRWPFLIYFSVLSILFAIPGCAAIASVLPKVVAAITEAEQILNTIERHSDAFFAAMPDPQKQKSVEEVLERCRLALHAAQRSTAAAENVTEAEAGAALKDFREAYSALLLLTAPMGVKQRGEGEEPLMSAAPGVLVVPPPLAMKLGS